MLKLFSVCRLESTELWQTRKFKDGMEVLTWEDPEMGSEDTA